MASTRSNAERCCSTSIFCSFPKINDLGSTDTIRCFPSLPGWLASVQELQRSFSHAGNKISFAGRRTSGGWIGSMIASSVPISCPVFDRLKRPFHPGRIPVFRQTPLVGGVQLELSQLFFRQINAPKDRKGFVPLLRVWSPIVRQL